MLYLIFRICQTLKVIPVYGI